MKIIVLFDAKFIVVGIKTKLAKGNACTKYSFLATSSKAVDLFERHGETKIRISKTPEPVYYHPLRSCAPSASSMNIKLEESVVTRLSDSNKQLLWREFRVRFK